jgi:radical SAM superfamily enzyme YgiQ (UPF0313 family)
VNILLVYPRNPDTFWSFKHVLNFVSKKSAFPPLGLLTVAAMLPREWQLKLVDLNVQPLEDRDLSWADYVFLSGMIVHKASAHEIALRCVSLGKTVVAGGPLFTTGYSEFPEISHFVLGEAEDVAGKLVDDIEQGKLQRFYQSQHWPDVHMTPVPRWDLIDLHDYVAMPVQFSRGCPFDCEFCDIVVMNGRVPRTKEPAQVVRELEALREHGWKDMVFIVDDNFIGNRKRTRALLRTLVEWRKRDSRRYFSASRRRRRKVLRNATNGRTARAISATRYAPFNAREWKSWAGSSWVSTATRGIFSSASSSSSSSPGL